MNFPSLLIQVFQQDRSLIGLMLTMTACLLLVGSLTGKLRMLDGRSRDIMRAGRAFFLVGSLISFLLLIAGGGLVAVFVLLTVNSFGALGAAWGLISMGHKGRWVQCCLWLYALMASCALVVFALRLIFQQSSEMGELLIAVDASMTLVLAWVTVIGLCVLVVQALLEQAYRAFKAPVYGFRTTQVIRASDNSLFGRPSNNANALEDTGEHHLPEWQPAGDNRRITDYGYAFDGDLANDGSGGDDPADGYAPPRAYRQETGLYGQPTNTDPDDDPSHNPDATGDEAKTGGRSDTT